MPVREKFVRSGDWRTLETFWNVTTTAWFQKPPDAEVKIRYSGWLFGADRQRPAACRLDFFGERLRAIRPFAIIDPDRRSVARQTQCDGTTDST